MSRISEEKVAEVADLLMSLSREEREAVLQKIGTCGNEIVPEQPLTMHSKVESERFKNGRVCPHCGGVHVQRDGHRKDGAQKFVCMDCGKSFVSTTNTAVKGTRKSPEVWDKFMKCMSENRSLKSTAKICGICEKTAFNWRHLVLGSVDHMDGGALLSGIVESDGAYLAVSYKGNHMSSSSFTMPRAPHKRGGKQGRGLSKDLICIPCAFDRNGTTLSRATSQGECSIEDLESGLGGRISAGSTLCTDASPSQRKFGKESGFDVVQIKGGKGKKGIYHIQHVNNYHSQMKSFFLSFKGVSSKYVNNYLTWFNAEYLNSEAQAVEIFRQAILSEDNSWTTRNLSHRKPVPRNPQKEQRAENRIRRRSKNNQGTK